LHGWSNYIIIIVNSGEAAKQLLIDHVPQVDVMNPEEDFMIGVFIGIIVVIVFLLIQMRIVPQAHAYVIERLGRYHETWNAGFHVMIPFIDRICRKVLLKEQVADFAPQPVITKDNVTMMIDSVVYFRVVDPKLYAYGVENPIMAMENLTATTLRNIIGDLTLDDTLTSRETINSQMLQTIDIATDPWGIKVTRVELKNIQPPAAIKESMEKQMKAERDKRAAILTAEGQKQSMILEAEGHKESAVLNAEAAKQATILAAEGEKEREIREAEGQAEAIRAVQQAQSDGIRMLREAGADEAVLKLKAMEAFAKAADGQATKIIIPSEIQGIAGLAESLKDTVVK
jgi:regulator of protease activity HflC (stomatin/prohibitin superfamily)